MRKNITISKELNESLKAYCKEQGITNSQLIEVAVHSYLTLYKASKELAKNISANHKKVETK